MCRTFFINCICKELPFYYSFIITYCIVHESYIQSCMLTHYRTLFHIFKIIQTVLRHSLTLWSVLVPRIPLPDSTRSKAPKQSGFCLFWQSGSVPLSLFLTPQLSTPRCPHYLSTSLSLTLCSPLPFAEPKRKYSWQSTRHLMASAADAAATNAHLDVGQAQVSSSTLLKLLAKSQQFV